MADDVECKSCRGPCRVPAWVRDGSWYGNNPSKFAAAVARDHLFLEPKHLAGVERDRAAIRAELAVRPPGYPCRDCGKFAFPVAGTVCFWCKRLPLRDSLG